eukprot:m.222595 g.222595  ORF g.222595 m.222595 type:complete len:508 (+) comp16064_c0_seq1:94-1617(+)
MESSHSHQPIPAPLGLSARLSSYPVLGRAFSKLSGVYDQYGKHSSHASIRRCVDVVESSISAHKDRVEPLVHAGLDRLEHSVDTLRHSALADHATAIADRASNLAQHPPALLSTAAHTVSHAATTARSTVNNVATTAAHTVNNVATTARSTVTNTASALEARGASLLTTVTSSAAAIESRVAALAGAGIDVAEAIIDWALPELPKKSDDSPAPTAACAAATEAATEPGTTRLGDGTVRVLRRVVGVTSKVRARLMPSALHRITQARVRCQGAVTEARSYAASVTTRVQAAKASVSAQREGLATSTRARVRGVRTAMRAKVAEIRLQRIVNHLVALGLAVSARSLELALTLTPDSLISLFRRSTGFDLRQIRRRLRIVATRARNGEPLIPPSAFSTHVASPTRASRHAPASTSLSAGSSITPKATSPTRIVHDPTTEPHVRVVPADEFRELAAAHRAAHGETVPRSEQRQEDEEDEEEEDAEAEEHYSSDEVDEDAEESVNTSVTSND